MNSKISLAVVTRPPPFSQTIGAIMNIAVVGLGKAGLPLAVVVTESGLKCIGVDVNKDTVEKINNGIAPFEGEPGLEEALQKYKGNQFVATADPKKGSEDSTVHIVIVPLFIDKSKIPDFSIIDGAMKGVAQGLKKGDLADKITELYGDYYKSGKVQFRDTDGKLYVWNIDTDGSKISDLSLDNN